MRRFLLLFALAANVAALAAVPAAAHPRDFTVLGVHTHTIQKPSGALSFREKLLRHHKRVGHAGVHCRPNAAHRLDCKGTFFFHNGTVKAEAVIGNSPDNVATIIAGTGAYAGVKGKVLLHQISNRRERDKFRFS